MAKILVVDDEAHLRRVVSLYLRARNYELDTAENGVEAIHKVAIDRPDLIIADIGMPGMDGYQLMRRIRASEPKARRVPAVALTAFARAEDRKRAIIAGYQTHLAKPFDIAELIIVVAGLLGRAEQR